MTISVSIEEFRARITEILGQVLESKETVVVRRADGRSFALVPDLDFQCHDETAYLTATST